MAAQNNCLLAVRAVAPEVGAHPAVPERWSLFPKVGMFGMTRPLKCRTPMGLEIAAPVRSRRCMEASAERKGNSTSGNNLEEVDTVSGDEHCAPTAAGELSGCSSLFPWQAPVLSLMPMSAVQPCVPLAMGSFSGPGELPKTGSVRAEMLQSGMAVQPAVGATLSQSEATGIILRAAMGTGWTTLTGLEGPSLMPGFPSPQSNPGEGLDGPGEERSSNSSSSASRGGWPELSSSPRRTVRVEFTCMRCGTRTMRAINPHAYGEGTVFVQCSKCLVFHKLVDNLHLFHELSGRIFQGSGAGAQGFGAHESVDILGLDGREDFDWPSFSL